MCYDDDFYCDGEFNDDELYENEEWLVDNEDMLNMFEQDNEKKDSLDIPLSQAFMIFGLAHDSAPRRPKNKK